MESSTDEFVTKYVSRKMHMHMFDGENIDLRQVMKDVYENFTLVFEIATAQLSTLGRKIPCDGNEYKELKKTLGFLITFSRCMLKRCVEEDTGATNGSLVDILTDIESHFVDILKCGSKILLSGGDLTLPQKAELEKLASLWHMVTRVSDAFISVFSTTESSRWVSIHNDESMVEFLDQVLEDLKGCDMNDKNTKALIINVEVLMNYLQSMKGWLSREGLNELFIYAEGVAETAACYTFFNKYGGFYVREQYLLIKTRLESKIDYAVLLVMALKLQDSTDLPPLTDAILKGYVDCVQGNLTKLTHRDEATNLMTDLIRKELEFLVGLIINYPPKHEAHELEKLLDIRIQFETLVRNVGSFVILALEEETRGNMTTEMSLPISDLFQKTYLLKGRITDILLLITFGRIGQNSPQTGTLGFLDYLIENLREFKDFTFNLKTYEAGGFQTIHNDLVLLRSFLQKMAGNGNSANDEESKDLLNRIRCAAYEAEHFIYSYVGEAIPDWCGSLWFSDFKQQVELIRATFADISEKRLANDTNNIHINVASSNNPARMPSLALHPTTDVVVGFEAEMEILIERLVSDSRKLDVVSIVGMAGLGKTTLAKKVHEDPSIVDHFQLRAWCCVSQEYDKKELLLTILGSITNLTADASKKSEGDLSVMVHKQLTGRRYLIVMDDIWGIDALKDLKRFFPDNSNGSRIMLTSRNRLQDYSDPLELRFLTDEESWDLLRQKVYEKDEEPPLVLCQVGKKIAEKCSGLPLAIVVVAGILAKSEKKRDFWEEVARNLSLHIAGDTTTHGQVTAALELSYKHLPDNLKPLFLYLGAFPEDAEIPTNKLTWLWIAEGFVNKSDNLKISLEVQAELNLMDLVGRSLVMISKRRSDGRVKSCRIHDLLRDMCLGKAKEENFMRQINMHDEQSPDSVSYERRLSISIIRRQNDTPSTPPRSSFVVRQDLPMLSVSHPLTSFLVFNMNKSLPLSEEGIKSVFRGFKLLRILHSESITFDANLFRDHVVLLTQLRYISFRTNWNLIPSSISKTWNLETLIIKGLRGEIVVPREILNMVRLRHLHINDRADFNSALSESSSKLENLETLSTPAVCYEEEKKLIQIVPKLRKLRCIFVEARNFHRNHYQLPQLESLHHLESLKMLCYGRMQHSGKFGLPSTLKKLTLSKFRLQWSEISSFQKLQNLEVLKLRGGAVEGAVWDTGDGEFPKLKFLQLETLNIKQWIVSADNFPCLKKLVFKSCKQLEEIPSSVGDFYSLEKIEVVWCSASAAKSAKLIQEEQKDAGNELLKVQVYMSF